MEVIRHGNEKLQSKEQKIEETERRFKLDTPKKLLEGTQKQKPVTNDIHKLKTRANETEYWKKYNDNNNTTIMRAVYSLAHYYH